MSSSTPEDIAARLEAIAGELLELAEQALSTDDTRAIPQAALQQVLTAGTRLFAHKVEQGEHYFLPILDRDAVTPTDAAILITEMMRAVNLNLFDLSMWAGRRETIEDSGPAGPG